MQRTFKICLLLAILMQILQVIAHYSVRPYSTNRLPLSYNGEKALRSHIHSHHYQRLPKKLQQSQLQQQQQQQQYAPPSIPYYNFNSNLRKKPTTTSNLIVYNKRYKRYPPYQTMPEIPIKKPIGRYLPYTPLYHMGLILPYYHPSAARLMAKPTILPTMPTTTTSNNYLPATNLLYNYLRLIGANNNKPIILATTIKPITTTTTSTTTTTTERNNNESVNNMLGNFHVESKIKFLDSPFSASNLRQHHHHHQQQQQEHNYFQNNEATHFNFPIMPATTISPMTTITTTTAQSILGLPYRSRLKMLQHNDEKEFDFVPTWYPYVKPQKSNNFFTIADAITPYKPIEANTMSYQPYFYEPRTENYVQAKPTTMGFMPVNDIYGSYTKTFRTTNFPLTNEFDEDKNKWTVIKSEETEIKTTKPTVQEINTTSSTTTSTTMPTTKVSRMRKVDRTTTKKPKSFFDDWFGEDELMETTETSKNVDSTTTTSTTTTTPTTTTTIGTKLKWPNKRRAINNTEVSTSTMSIIATTTATTLPTGVVKKPRKKYANNKHKQNRHKNTNTNNTINIENNDENVVVQQVSKNNNNTKSKLHRRIKKVLRVRPTLVPVLKLKKNLPKIHKFEEFTTDLPTTTIRAVQEITIIPTTSSSTSTTTTTTMSSSSSSTTTSTLETNISRKRGRQTYHNQYARASSTEQSKRQKYKTSSSTTTERATEARQHYKQRHGRTRPSTTTTSTVAPTEQNLHSATNRSYQVRERHAQSTAETAIMNLTNNRSRRVQNVLEKLMLPVTTQISNTEIPQLPIELYFQKTKTGFD